MQCNICFASQKGQLVETEEIQNNHITLSWRTFSVLGRGRGGVCNSLQPLFIHVLPSTTVKTHKAVLGHSTPLSESSVFVATMWLCNRISKWTSSPWERAWIYNCGTNNIVKNRLMYGWKRHDSGLNTWQDDSKQRKRDWPITSHSCDAASIYIVRRQHSFRVRWPVDNLVDLSPCHNKMPIDLRLRRGESFIGELAMISKEYWIR